MTDEYLERSLNNFKNMYPPIICPLIAANYANEIASQIVSVQPMNDVAVNDLATVFAVVDEMKKNLGEKT